MCSIVLRLQNNGEEKKKRMNCLLIQEKENSRLIYKRQRRKTPCRLPKPESSTSAKPSSSVWKYARPMWAGEVNGHKTSCPNPPASMIKKATGSNP
jgi:hypothetical protein